MGLLDSVIGALGQSQGGGGGGGGQAALINAVIGMLTQGGGAAGGAGGAAGGLGGLGGLLEQFTRGGLGDVAKSWVGTGQNLPISPDQLSQVLGGDMLGQLAQQLGLGHQETASQLSQVLPQVVDHLTPGGQLPPQGTDLAALGNIDGLLNSMLRR
jgi:uncharacterized protein YidB (DUF937 family)